MANVIPLFSTPIYLSKIEPVTADEFNAVTSLIYDGKYSADKYVLEREEFATIKTKIEDEISYYVYDTLKVSRTMQFYLTNSWVVKHEKGDESQLHRHDNSLLSGVVYIKTNDATGAIVFDSGTPSNIFPPVIRLEYSQLNLINAPSWVHQPFDNDILVFPSHVLHKVEKNTSEETRYSLAFNLFFRGKLGEDMSILELK